MKHSDVRDATDCPTTASLLIDVVTGKRFRIVTTKQHIRVVDDNPLQAATRKTILEREGYSVAVSSTGRDALAKLRDPNLRGIGLLITDHLMPEMNGPELIKEIRTFLPALSILVLSGMAGAEDEYLGMNVAFRSKPFPPQQLIELVGELLHEPIARTA